MIWGLPTFKHFFHNCWKTARVVSDGLQKPVTILRLQVRSSSTVSFEMRVACFPVPVNCLCQTIADEPSCNGSHEYAYYYSTIDTKLDEVVL